LSGFFLVSFYRSRDQAQCTMTRFTNHTIVLQNVYFSGIRCIHVAILNEAFEIRQRYDTKRQKNVRILSSVIWNVL